MAEAKIPTVTKIPSMDVNRNVDPELYDIVMMLRRRKERITDYIRSAVVRELRVEQLVEDGASDDEVLTAIDLLRNQYRDRSERLDLIEARYRKGSKDVAIAPSPKQAAAISNGAVVEQEDDDALASPTEREDLF